MWNQIRKLKIGGVQWELLPDEVEEVVEKKPFRWVDYEEVKPQEEVVEFVKPKRNESTKKGQKRKPKK